MRQISHDELVRVGDRWLRNQKRCGVVFPEVSARVLREEPDVIGWKKYGKSSILIECKASRPDFLSDKKKLHRDSDKSMGNIRYYLTPKGLVKREEVPPYWGLLYYDGRGIKEVKRPTNIRLSYDALFNEKLLMYSELRRFHILLSSNELNNSRNGRRVRALLEAYDLSTAEIPEYEADYGQQLEIPFD